MILYSEAAITGHQWNDLAAKVLATKPDDLSLVPGTQTVELTPSRRLTTPPLTWSGLSGCPFLTSSGTRQAHGTQTHTQADKTLIHIKLDTYD